LGKDYIKQSRILSFNDSVIVEKDTRSTILSIHKITDIYALIRYKDDKLFGIEYKKDKTYKYSSETRDLLLLDILEMCKRQNNPCFITTEDTNPGIKEGAKGELPVSEYSDFLFKKMSYLDKEMNEWKNRIIEFNYSFPPGKCVCKDKNILRTIFKMFSLIKNSEGYKQFLILTKKNRKGYTNFIRSDSKTCIM